MASKGGDTGQDLNQGDQNQGGRKEETAKEKRNKNGALPAVGKKGLDRFPKRD